MKRKFCSNMKKMIIQTIGATMSSRVDDNRKQIYIKKLHQGIVEDEQELPCKDGRIRLQADETRQRRPWH